MILLSLLLCVGAAVLWVRGYWQWAVVGWNAPRPTRSGFTDRFVGVSSADGKIVLVSRHFTWLSTDPAAEGLGVRWPSGYFFAPYTCLVREDLANRRVGPYSSRDPADRTKCITFPGGCLNSFDMPATATQRGMTGYDLVVPAAPACAVLAAGPAVAFLR